MPDIDVSAVLDELATSAADNESIGNQKAALEGQMAGIKNQEAARQTSAGNAAADLAVTSGMGLLKAQEAVQSSKANFEFDKADPNNYKDVLEKDFLQNYKTGRALRDQIAAKQSVSFFDDPLAFISNQFTLSSDIAKYNAVAQNANSSLDTINKIDSTLTNTAQQEAATAKTLNLDGIAKKAELARNAFDNAASTASYQALQANVSGLDAIRQGNNAKVDRIREQWQTLKSAEQLELQKKTNEISLARLQLELDKEAEKKQSREADIAIIRAGRAKAGLPDFNPAQLGNLKLMLGTPEGKARFAKEYELGLQAVGDPDAQVKLGYGVADAALTAATLKGNFDPKINPSAPAVLYGVGLLREIPAQVGTKKDAVENWVNTRAQQDFASWNSNPENSPLYKLPSLQTIAQNPEIANSAFFKEVLAGSAAAGSQGMPAKDMIDSGLKAVKEGRLTTSEFTSGLAKYVKTGIDINSANNYLGAVPPQDGYKVTIPGTGIVGGNKYDISKPEILNAAVAKLLSNESAKLGGFRGQFGSRDLEVNRSGVTVGEQ